jgi:hypothetical protein
MRWVLSCVLCCGFALSGCDGDGTAPVVEQPLVPAGTQLVVSGFAHARVLEGNGSTTLTARLIGPDGAPLADLSIVALAPDAGSSGAFADPAPEGAHIARAVTDADGSVSFEFTANAEAGSFLVELTVEGTSLSITIAVTIVAQLPQPATTASDARRLLSEDVLQDDSPDGYLLHGPFYVPAGTQVVTDFGDANDGVVFDVTADSWFFWEDDEPDGLFEHPVRYHLLDAAIAAPVAGDVQTVDGERWPEVLYSGAAESVALLPPTHTNKPTDLDDIAPPIEPQPIPTLAQSQFRNECAIVVVGPKEATKLRNARRVGDFFRLDRKTLYIQVKDDEPATFEDLKKMIQNAKEARCPKLFLYIGGHGYRQGDPAVQLGREGDRSKAERVSYKEIADELEAAFGDTTSKVCLIIESCFSERAILDFQGRGLMGEIAVSSVHDSFSWYDPARFSYFTEFLIDCWTGPVAPGVDTDNNGEISLAEARAWVDTSRRPIDPGDARRWMDARKAKADHGITTLNECDVYVAAQRSLAHAISPDGVAWNTNGEVPDAELFVGETVQIEIKRPAGNDGLDRTAMDVEVVVQNPGVAFIPGAMPGATFTLNVADDTLTLQVIGVGPGTTTYTVKGAGRRDVFAGTGTITVKSPFVKLEHALGPYAAGEEVPLTAIQGGSVGMGPECDNLPHLHGTVVVDDVEYQDPNPDGCGWGVVIGYPDTAG